MSARVNDLLSFFMGLTPLSQAALIMALVAVVAIVSLLIVIVSNAVRLRVASRAGRRVSVSPKEAIPLTNFARDGKPSDPLNVRVIGTADQLSSAFVSAGWYRADELSLITSLRITFDAILGRKYSTAPVSDLYLFGRKQDYAFEKPGRNVRERDHVRFWKGEHPASDGRPVWVGGATRDAKVELARTNHLPTHGIAPNVDDERNLIADDLIGTGWVIAERSVPVFDRPMQTRNATGDTYHTDGQAVQLTLAYIQPVPLLPQLIREPGASLVQRATRRLRRNLPQQGRELARRWAEQRAKARSGAKASAPPQPRQPNSAS